MKRKYSHSDLLHLFGLQQKGSPKTTPSISQNTENVLRYSSPSRNAVVGYPFLDRQMSSWVGLKCLDKGKALQPLAVGEGKVHSKGCHSSPGLSLESNDAMYGRLGFVRLSLHRLIDTHTLIQP